MQINIIATMTVPHQVIDLNSNLPWDRIPGVPYRLTQLTRGNPIIVGRKTWDSLPVRPLPDRTNIVMTRNLRFSTGCASFVCGDFQSAVDSASRLSESGNVFVIGGSSIYKEALPLADRLYLTLIHDASGSIVGDTYFPAIEGFETGVTRERLCTGPYEADFVVFERS